MTTNQTLDDSPIEWSPTTPATYGFLWVVVACAGVVAFFWIGIPWIVEGWQKPEYSHGYLIAPIAVYLFLDRLRNDPVNPDRPQGGMSLGIVVIAASFAIGLLGNVANIPGVVAYGLVICIGGSGLLIFGARRGVTYWAPVAYLLFMIPLPSHLYWQLSIRLQFVSSEIGVALIKIFGIPVFLDGNIIDLGVYKLQVAEACSGLRYLFPLMSFGFLFAIIYKGPSWHKMILFLAALPVAIFTNCVRIAAIGFLVKYKGIEQAEGFLHFFEGWIIFAMSIVLLYFVAFILQHLIAVPKPIYSMLDLDLARLTAQLRRAHGIKQTRALRFVAAILLGVGVLWQLSPSLDSTPPQRDPFAVFPMTLGDWRGSTVFLDRSIELNVAADDYLSVDFADDLGEQVNFFVAYYENQTDGTGIHSPEVCIPGSGWEVSEWERVYTGLQTLTGDPLFVNCALHSKGHKPSGSLLLVCSAWPPIHQRLHCQSLYGIRRRYPPAPRWCACPRDNANHGRRISRGR